MPFVISGSALPSGTTIQVDNVDFLAVVGAVRIDLVGLASTGIEFA